ncbi:MAG TPA: hypothetical protein VEO54_22625 [Thermoanaerobaculia bacterium]|nr:hypothetical protein [Thermoanaerobaculia bacterium]
MTQLDVAQADLCRLTLPKQSRLRAKGPKGPHALDFRIRRYESYGNSQAPIPERLLLIRPTPGDPSGDQLFLDQVPLPRDAWRFDEQDRIISWHGAYGGGHLYLTHQDLGATGNIGVAHDPVSVMAASTAHFLCDVALNTGATYLTSSEKIIGLTWDPASIPWKRADWIRQRLLLSYTVTPGGPMEPPAFTFEFADQQTQAIPWAPVAGSFSASLALGEQSGQMVWDLTFLSSGNPARDKGKPATGPDTVYPYWMQAVEDAAAATINGVLQIDAPAPHGNLVGMQGERVQATASGFFRTSADAAPFAVFDGRLTMDGRPAGQSCMRGAELQWRNLDPQHQQRTGLPESGTLRFTADGSRAAAPDHSLSANRLRAGAVAAALARHSDLHPTLHQRATEMAAAVDDGTLTISGLLAMTPFVRDSSGAWADVVQGAVTSDLGAIMNSYIPPAMWKLIFGKDQQPTLSGELAAVANTPVEGYPSPGTWYATLSTAVVSQGLAAGRDPVCAKLNGPRAAAWLKTEVAGSKVYNRHSQLLFKYEWQQRFTLTSAYLADQVRNAATYAPQIDAQVTAQVNDINWNVAVDANTPPKLIQTLTTQVQDAGNYAKTNKLYWAFAFYTYNTAPAILANISLQMSVQTGSSDGTTLSRLIQQNMEVLTALDPSGFFAREYTATLDTFLTTNILPSMFGFTGEAMSFDIIKLYLQQFVAANLRNEDRKIADAAQQLQAILADANADEMLRSSIEAVRAFSEAIDFALALPYVTQELVEWFEGRYPKFSATASFFGTAFVGGVTALAIFNVIGLFKQWDKLTPGQKTETIIDATGLGLQVLAGVVTRGVRTYAMYGVNGMTRMQRAAAIGKIIVKGDAPELGTALAQIGNATARWLGDTQGTAGTTLVANVVTKTATVAGAEEASWAAKILGKNLDEFIATRVGPVLIVAGIGLNLYFIIEGESGVALAADILNMVGGSLMLFAMIGTWAGVAEGGLMAGLVSIAGPLAVLAALAGVGLMIYQMFHKPPNPVEQFVTEYAQPAGFAVAAKQRAIDYALVYANPDLGSLLMIGFTLAASGMTLACNSNGSLSLLGAPTALPNCVWVAETDGLGQTQIMAMTQRDPTQRPVALWLSLMSDNTVSFQPKLQPLSATPVVPPTGPSVSTQTWLSAPQGNATLTSKGQLSSIGLTFQPVRPDKSGNYKPSNASGWLAAGSGGVSYSASAPATFTLRMSAMAPNYMTMEKLNFILDSTPSPAESFGPAFGLPPSTPMTFSHTGQLPAFLSFNATTGTFSPNGRPASTQQQLLDSIAARNAAGAAAAPFAISVASPPALA